MLDRTLCRFFELPYENWKKELDSKEESLKRPDLSDNLLKFSHGLCPEIEAYFKKRSLVFCGTPKLNR